MSQIMLRGSKEIAVGGNVQSICYNNLQMKFHKSIKYKKEET